MHPGIFIKKLWNALVIEHRPPTPSWRYKKFLNRLCEIFGKRDYSGEVYEGEKIISNEGHPYHGLLDPAKRKNFFPQKLLTYIYELREKQGDLKLLELGPGPFSDLAYGAEQRMFSISAVDPIADAYDKFFKKHNIAYPVKAIKGCGEKLLKLFNENTFDIVYSSNALDHTKSPKKCVENMYRVVKKGGIIFLKGYAKEGTRQKWQGLHKHNQIPVNGQLIDYDRRGKMQNLTAGLGLSCICEEKNTSDPHGWYTIVFKKV